jgi:signal transduction histidine kinase
LTISDNGIGCAINDEIRGVGLINIRSRTELYNGSLNIKSKQGEGFELKAVLNVIEHA